MKVGKEEAMAMLAAVEMWMKRDHKSEYQAWSSWMNNIAAAVSKIDGVKATVREPEGLSNHTPGLSITWDPSNWASPATSWRTRFSQPSRESRSDRMTTASRLPRT